MVVDITQRYIKEKDIVKNEIQAPVEIIEKKQNLYFETPTKDIFHKIFSILFWLWYTYRNDFAYDDNLFEKNKEFTFLLGREDWTIDYWYTWSKFFSNEILKKENFQKIELEQYIWKYGIDEMDITQIERSILDLEFKEIELFEQKKVEEIKTFEDEIQKYNNYKSLFEKNEREELVIMTNKQIKIAEDQIELIKNRKYKNIQIMNNVEIDNDDIIPDTKKYTKHSKDIALKPKKKRNYKKKSDFKN